MSLALDLLNQAALLAALERSRPKQARLRRSISTSCYALFHLLCAECSQRFSPVRPASLLARIARSLTHGEMREVCSSVVRTPPSMSLTKLSPDGFSDQLKGVADAFLELQKERHAADYDLSASYVRSDALATVDLANDAFAGWNSVRNTDEATVFLAALLFAKRWSR